MKKRHLLLLSVAAVGVFAVALAEDAPRPKPVRNPEIEELRAQVAQLRAEVQALESRMNKVEVQTQRPTVPTPLNPSQSRNNFNFVPKPLESPKIWGEREVNGWTFYVVPCETAAR